MSFDDRFAITDIIPEGKQRLSMSIDNFDEGVIPVLLLVEDVDKHDHDHVPMTRESLMTFRDMFEDSDLEIVFSHGWQRMTVESYNNGQGGHILIDNTQERGDFSGELSKYRVFVTEENVQSIKDWIDIFLSKTPQDLEDKWNKEYAKS